MNGEGHSRTLNPNCTDKHDDPGWSCIEFDGTGLWCDSCLAVDRVECIYCRKFGTHRVCQECFDKTPHVSPQATP